MRSLPASDDRTPLLAAGPALGKAIELSGIRAVPLILAAVSAVCLATTVWLIRATATRAAAATRPAATAGPSPAQARGPRTPPRV